MTKEEKKLLFKDLCARLPYKVKITIREDCGEEMVTDTLRAYYISDIGCLEHPEIESYIEKKKIKPYLRPMSSMTEEEKNELKIVTCPNGTGYFNEQYLVCPVNHFGEQISFDFMADIIDWLNAHHFDYHCLIEKGLALPAPEGMYD